MARVPSYKAFNEQGTYRAAFKDLSEALLFIGTMGYGWSVRLGHAKGDTLFTVGVDEPHPNESVDGAYDTAYSRI